MDSEIRGGLCVLFGFLLLLLCTIGGCLYFGPTYDVWNAQMKGKAQYAEAVSSRQIKVLEAEAKQQSAKYEAQAEIVRAEGVAKANKIIGDSLKGNESYLRYLWIQNLNSGTGERIYIPTEAGLPILEARDGHTAGASGKP